LGAQPRNLPESRDVSGFMGASRPGLVGINHVALEVDDLGRALAFWRMVFGEIEVDEGEPGMAFIDLGDQFVALAEREASEAEAHFGLVVDDKDAARAALDAAGADIVPSRGLDFRDPWGNLVQVVDYRDIQFTKTPEVLRAMGLDGLSKTPAALDELREKGVEVAG
jgi:predicted enzyme related to lactoylglutathione lyase